MTRWLLVMAALAGCAKSEQRDSPAPPGDDARVAAWREDLAALAKELPARHVDAFFAVEEQAWRDAVVALDGRLATLDDAQIEAELRRLVAMLGDGHTALMTDPPQRAAVYPLNLYWFEDGIFALDGRGQVVAVGGTPIDEVIATLTPLIPHDNRSQLKNMIPFVLVDPVLLRGAGLAATTERASFTLRTPDGAEQTVELTPGPPTRPKAPSGDLPLALQRRHSHYWNDYLADQRLYYFQYLQCADARDYPFARLVAGTLGFADQKRDEIDRFVIDLRFNGGGDSRVIKPLIDGLAARPELAKKVYVIIGRSTFSSAVLNAIELERRLDAVLVGEPTGGKPSHHGEVKTFTLPRSRMIVQYSTKYFRNPDHPGDAVMPDLPVAARYADWEALRDPVLEAIAAHVR